VVRDVSIYRFTGHAITTSSDDQQSETPAYLYSSRFERIAAKASAGVTFGFTNTTDSLFTDLLTMEGGNVGFFIVGCGNSTFTSCRAEWNAGNGFDIKGGNGIVELLGCSTDRNTQNGVNIGPTNTMSDMIVLNGLRLRRDGRNGGAGGGGYAGLRIKQANTPVLVSALAVDTGKDDDPTSTAVPGPQYGVYTENPTLVVLDSGIVRGTTAGLQPPSAGTVKIGTGFVIL
jgi:hypothetical protein